MKFECFLVVLFSACLCSCRQELRPLPGDVDNQSLVVTNYTRDDYLQLESNIQNSTKWDGDWRRIVEFLQEDGWVSSTAKTLSVRSYKSDILVAEVEDGETTAYYFLNYNDEGNRLLRIYYTSIR